MTGEILAEEQYIRIKRCRNGLFMYNVNDQYVGQSLDHYGEFSEGEAELFRQFLKPGMIVLDVGANIGVHTVTFARLVKPDGAVIAFEPQRVVHQMLCGNIALNALDNVAALRMALGKQVGEILVPPMDYSKVNNFGGVELISSGRGEAVPLNTLDAFNTPNCHFIKIDVEGMEQDVIEGGLGLLARCKPILYVENDRREKSESLIGCLRKAGYLTYWHIPSLFNPRNYFGAADDMFPSVSSFNVLCVPQSSNIVIKGFIEVTPENAARRSVE
jgi:FkbM family methyltransferase